MVGHDHPPAYRFNGGQKMIYWIVVLGGGAVAVSGYLLMFPFYGTDIADHAERRDGPRHRRNAVHRRHARAHLYRHDRHGRRIRGHGRRARSTSIGRRSTTPVARARCPRTIKPIANTTGSNARRVVGRGWLVTRHVDRNHHREHNVERLLRVKAIRHRFDSRLRWSATGKSALVCNLATMLLFMLPIETNARRRWRGAFGNLGRTAWFPRSSLTFVFRRGD